MKFEAIKEYQQPHWGYVAIKLITGCRELWHWLKNINCLAARRQAAQHSTADREKDKWGREKQREREREWMRDWEMTSHVISIFAHMHKLCKARRRHQNVFQIFGWRKCWILATTPQAGRMCIGKGTYTTYTYSNL